MDQTANAGAAQLTPSTQARRSYSIPRHLSLSAPYRFHAEVLYILHILRPSEDPSLSTPRGPELDQEPGVITTEAVSLRQALTLEPLRRARVVAGAAGLDRLVSHVNVMEVPDITAYVKPNQLLLTTAYPLRDERAALADLVPCLHELGLAGLAIKPARYIEVIPEVMVEAADRLSFPLLELPPETSFEEIINAILGQILNGQALRLQRSAAIHDRFTRIVLSGGGLREIATALAELIAKGVLVVDQDGSVLARSARVAGTSLNSFTPAALPVLSGLEASVDDSRRLRWLKLAPDDGPRSAAVQPIQVDTWRQAAIVVLTEPEALGEDELIAIEHASTVAALRMVQERAVADADRRFRAVCLEELVTGHVVDRDALRERALAFGWDLSVPRAVLLAELEALNSRRFGDLVGPPEAGRALHLLAEAASVAFGKQALVWERSTGIAALIPIRPGPQPRQALLDTGKQLQVEAQRRLAGSEVGVGIGRVCEDPLDLQRSHLEALRAIRVGRQARGAGRLSLFEDLGLDRLLTSCPENELVSFRDATLGSLVAYDAAHGTDLVATLDAFFSHNRNMSGAARSLFIHYNTLKNRLDRVEQLIGPVLDDPARCLDLALALRISQLPGQR